MPTANRTIIHIYNLDSEEGGGTSTWGFTSKDGNDALQQPKQLIEGGTPTSKNWPEGSRPQRGWWTGHNRILLQEEKRDFLLVGIKYSYDVFAYSF